MPVIIQSQETHPFLPSLGSHTAIEAKRALTQDIRPLEIAILNLMADKQTTERQLAQWLGSTALQIDLTFVCTDSYADSLSQGHQPTNTPLEHIQKFYRPWREIKDRKFDGLVLTGVNALQDRVEQEKIWPDVENILRWSETNVFSSLFLCWGAKAALKYFHDIDSYKAERKLFGLFEHTIASDKTGLMFGFPDAFSIPVSRWKSPRREDIEKCEALEILADSKESGPNILVESKPYDSSRNVFPHRVYILNHPEYDTETLGNEFKRDRANFAGTPLPAHYFPDDDPSREVSNSWRHTGSLYANWIRRIYPAAPADINEIPHVYDGIALG